MRVLGFGDNIVDRFVDRGVDYPGGNSVNVAVYARRLGLEAAYLGVFGDDDLGRFLGETIAAEGVAVDRCVVRPGETGLSLLRVDDGDRVFLGWNGGGVTVREPLTLDSGLLEYVSSFDLVHSSVYSRSEDELPKLAGLGTLVSFDLSSEEEFRAPPTSTASAPTPTWCCCRAPTWTRPPRARCWPRPYGGARAWRSPPAACTGRSPGTDTPPCRSRHAGWRTLTRSSTRWGAATPSSPGSRSRCCATAGPRAPRRGPS
nr:hypothetical protein GCM10020093_037540 [Planobispora longispora]